MLGTNIVAETLPESIQNSIDFCIDSGSQNPPKIAAKTLPQSVQNPFKNKKNNDIIFNRLLIEFGALFELHFAVEIGLEAVVTALQSGCHRKAKQINN